MEVQRQILGKYPSMHYVAVIRPMILRIIYLHYRAVQYHLTLGSLMYTYWRYVLAGMTCLLAVYLLLTRTLLAEMTFGDPLYK
ncbi:hypothetical protein GGS20DRAFT_542131 [Poronia punctata]|nr:hypothetical protein GGS20DRAFT_542131 [Poronia punctata]